MKPMNADEIFGNYATLLLPINEDDTIDYVRLQEEIDYLIAAGVSGIYSNGTAGEFHTQSEEEFVRVNEMLAVACQKVELPFQVGASHMSPQLSLARIKRAVAWKPSAIQIILADWFSLKDDEILSCLKRFAEAANPIGIVVYNPPHAKRIIPPELYARIHTEIPEVVGIKVAGGDVRWYKAMNTHAKGISIFVPGHFLASGYARGAQGAYSNVACLSPIGAQRWYERMRTDLPGAIEQEQRIVQFMTQHITPYITEQGYCNAACDKLLAAIGGWSSVGTRLRWPYRWIPAAEAERLRPLAQELIPEMFECSIIPITTC
ncbi:dihydrodipicolinate synthase family protein [Paenibacillus qinlingensis]|uniref:Dihydrodipicolinate synthase/N-acetylneuraminate lyase n=1 Tax=Paenibacillus qinlingensis TaxID=1837343 RepID=A0ABU1NS59_9BACL|nr:dihydrodipicolinate synthase family protein [Paenibacillus qinlingensis]MDR6550315.1 dihydrodipicolinate synthase/N-acetylneuraminate lyase [Paenibacillus qinlingensis]